MFATSPKLWGSSVCALFFLGLLTAFSSKPALAQDSQPAFDPRSIPPEQRVAYVNRLIAIPDEQNAWPLYREALKLARSPFDAGPPDASIAVQDAFSWVSSNDYALGVRPDWPDAYRDAIRAWLAANEPALEALKRGVQRPRLAIPFDEDGTRLALSTHLYRIAGLRGLVKCARVRANEAAIRGAWDDAFDWNECIARLGAQMAASTDYFVCLNGAGFREMADDQLLAFTARTFPALARPVIEARIRAKLDPCDPLIATRVAELTFLDDLEINYEWARDPRSQPSIDEALDGRDVLVQFAERGDLKMEPPRDSENQAAAYREELLRAPRAQAIAVGERLRECSRAYFSLPLPQAMATLTEYRAELARIASEHPHTHMWYAGDFTPPGAIRVIEARRESARSALRLLLALRKYHQKYGEWPDTAARLVPVFIDKLPPDGFDGQPLRYKRTAGGLMLYSVGENLRDDGGQPQPGVFQGWRNAPPGDYVLWPSVLPDYCEE